MNPQIQQLKQIMNQVQSSPNPQTALQNLLSSNPNYKNILDLARLNGGNLQQIFYTLARQRGVDPNLILQQLQS